MFSLFAYGFADFSIIITQYFLACLTLKVSNTTTTDDILIIFCRQNETFHVNDYFF